jgi:TonB family protein
MNYLGRHGREPVLCDARRGATGLVALLVTLVGACGASDGPATQRADAKEPGAAAGRDGLRQAAVPRVDEGHRDGMEVEGLRGHLTAYQIQKGVRPHQRALSRCYADHANHAYVGGRIVFGFDVARDGTVKRPTVSESALGAWAVEACLVEVVRQMTFDPPDGGEATVTLPLDFDARAHASYWHDDRAARELQAPPAYAPLPEELAPPERRRLALERSEALGEDEPRSKREDLMRCSEESGAQIPPGLRITVYIDRRGQVLSAGFSAQDVMDEAWATCAAARIAAWRMSAPQTPGVAAVKLGFPFPG